MLHNDNNQVVTRGILKEELVQFKQEFKQEFRQELKKDIDILKKDLKEDLKNELEKSNAHYYGLVQESFRDHFQMNREWLMEKLS